MVAATPRRRPGWRLTAIVRKPLSEDHRNLVLAGMLGLLIRAIFLIEYHAVLTPDSHSYLALAHRLGSTNFAGYDGSRTPGYPLLLLAVGYSPTVAWCVQACLGVITTLLIYRLVRALGGSPTAALVASLVYTTSIGVLAVERSVLTEALLTFLITVAAALSIRLVTTDRRRDAFAVLLGMVLALCCLVRPDALITAVVLAGCVVARWYFRAREAGDSSRSLLTRLALPALLILVPPLVALAVWAGVNKATTGITAVTTVTGMNMIDHVAPYVRVQPGRDSGITAAFVAWRTRVEARSGSYFNTSWAANPAMRKVSHLDFAHLSIRLQRIGLGVIASHPLQYLWLSMKDDFPTFWFPPDGGPADFRSGTGSKVIEAIWKTEVRLQLLVTLLFLAVGAADIVTRLRRRGAMLSAPSATLALAVLAGSLPVVFLGDGDASRHGYVYFPLVLAVCFGMWEPLLRSVWIQRRRAKHLVVNVLPIALLATLAFGILGYVIHLPMAGYVRVALPVIPVAACLTIVALSVNKQHAMDGAHDEILSSYRTRSRPTAS
jgi:hypothetical protein